MALSRQITKVVNKYIAENYTRIIVLTGARQVGKTTLVKKNFPEYDYLLIEDPILREYFLKLTASQWEKIYPVAALDEIQKAPQLIESIKAVYDNNEYTRYVLLGSSQILLLEKVKESLAGRCIIVDMFPLVLPELRTEATDFNTETPLSIFQELLSNPSKLLDFLPSAVFDKTYAEKQIAIDYYLRFGGYPALTSKTMTDEKRYTWLNNYVRTYLERDIRDLAAMRDLEPFAKLQRLVAVQTGQIINLATLSRLSGVTAPTVKRYLEYLNLSYQTITLPAWDRNRGKRFTKSPKIHYTDFGVIQALLQKRGGMTGLEFESAIVAEIYKQTKNLQIVCSFYHLRTHDGREVDLLMELPNGYIAFEIKMAEKVSKTDARHLLDLEPLLDKPLIYGFVLSKDTATTNFANNIIAVNAAMFLG